MARLHGTHGPAGVRRETVLKTVPPRAGNPCDSVRRVEDGGSSMRARVYWAKSFGTIPSQIATPRLLTGGLLAWRAEALAEVGSSPARGAKSLSVFANLLLQIVPL